MDSIRNVLEGDDKAKMAVKIADLQRQIQAVADELIENEDFENWDFFLEWTAETLLDRKRIMDGLMTPKEATIQ